MNGWQECKLGDVAEITSAKRIYYSEYVPNGVPFFRSKEIIERFNRQNTSTELFIKRERYEEIKLKFGAPQGGDILLTSVGTLGVPYLVRKEDEFYFKDGNLTWFRNINSKTIDIRFLYFWIISVIGQQKLYEASIGSTQPALTIIGLKDVEILLPPLPEQRAISGVLSSLDDKIDLLHRQNKTLEGMAEALWRKMFVEEADPGWKKGKLGDYITVKGGTTPSTKNSEYWDGEYSWTSPRDLSNSSEIYLHKTERTITKKGLSQIGSGLLPSGTVLLSSRAPIGYLAITNIPVAINQGYIAITCNRLFSKFFVYCWIKANLDIIVGSANGSTFLEISKSVFKDLEVIVPTECQIIKFESMVVTMFEKILNNEVQIRTLSRLRDTLLPKLMSGAVRVKV